MSKKRFMILFALIIILGFFMRFHQLDLKPMHHDEAVQWGSWLNNILEGNKIEYHWVGHGFGNDYLSVIPVYFGGTTSMDFLNDTWKRLLPNKE